MAGGSLYQSDDSTGAISDINVTPLVDVVLVLLVIFMVTANLIVARGINVNNPETKSGADVLSSLKVSIDVERRIFVNGVLYPDVAGAQAKVRELRGENEDIKAIIEADKDVTHGDVMRVMDFVKLAGVNRFAITSKPPSEDGD